MAIFSERSIFCLQIVLTDPLCKMKSEPLSR